MKIIVYMMLIFNAFGCQGQQKAINQVIMVPAVDNQFEKFDVETFNKENVRGKRTELSEKFFLEEDSQSFGYAQQRYPYQSYFSVLKLFYKNGSIKEKGVLFNNGSEYGIWYEFDVDGNLTKELDMDEGYNFTWDQTIKYCIENEIPVTKGYENAGYLTNIYKEEKDNGKKVWLITYQASPEKLMEITLDGKTGKEIDRKELEFVNN